MDVTTVIVQFLAASAGFLTALLSIILFVRLRWPAPALWFMKLYVSALSPVFLFIGFVSTIAGLATGSPLIALVGIYDAVIFSVHMVSVSRPPAASSGFEQAFGLPWKSRFNILQKEHFHPTRPVSRQPAVPSTYMEKDVPFATIPGTDRRLLCDVWQPHEGVTRSGLAFIYLHGGAWTLLDKDLGTRPLFSHLAAQGHVIMDVAYRLAPETDMMGMVHDTRRAIAWMKEHADIYGVDPARIVVGGGSSGAHIALLTAYTTDDPQFAPAEMGGKDDSLCAVVSLYGPTDLVAMYYHLNQHLTTRSAPGRPKKSVPAQMPGWMVRLMGENYQRLGFDKGFANAGSFAWLLAGHPDECPERYALFSPLTHIHSSCPPTLLIHGEHDVMVPVQTVRTLHTRLTEKGVPTVLHTLPQTDHAFDLVLPRISPAAHTAFNEVERFLSLQQGTVVELRMVAELS